MSDIVWHPAASEGEASATTAPSGSLDLPRRGYSEHRCLSCGYGIDAESDAIGPNNDWLKDYRARECSR